jgi:peptidoglycan glycosyltransferase
VVAGELRQRSENRQTAWYEQRIQRGFIAASGERIAGRTAQVSPDGSDVWVRRYPAGSFAAHVLGYDTPGTARAGVERAMNDSLTGSTRDLGAISGLLDGDDAAIGDDVTLTIQPKTQRAAEEALKRSGAPGGAVVVVDTRTGAVIAMASTPTFAPADVQRDFDAVAAREGSLLNRATQARYPPGSTFKILTAAAAIERGVEPDRTFSGGSEFRTPGGAIRNFGGASFGQHDFTTAFAKSINTSFAELGVELGDQVLREQMERFGFFEQPPLTGLPADEVRASGILQRNGTTLDRTGPIDEARTAIGQDRLAVTPLQMALVAAGIANNGAVPRPSLIAKVTTPGGRVVEQLRPRRWKQAVAPETAREVGTMMEQVVADGSGIGAAIEGVRVAGKTGTAEAPSGNVTWFVGYAPASAPRYAIAVALEGQPDGVTGGGVAAPIAREVLATLLSGSGGDA